MSKANQNAPERLVRPCPFCASTDIRGSGMHYPHDRASEYWRVSCWTCGATTRTFHGRPCRGFAWRSWNRRAHKGATLGAGGDAR